jgi:hypothetical protein
MIFTTRIGRRAILALTAFAVAVPLALAASANADQFNTFNTVNGWPSQAGTPMTRWNYAFRGCSVTVGPVADPKVSIGSPDFKTIGGARVSNCSTGGHTIGVTVREYAWTGSGQYFEVGNGVGTIFSNSSGFGYSASGEPRILELNLGCQGQRWYWMTGAYVTIDGVASGWIYSPWSDWKTLGC